MIIPKVNSIWEHKSGTLYEVILIPNINSVDEERYPVTVVYQNVDTGDVWSRPLAKWYTSMTELNNETK